MGDSSINPERDTPVPGKLVTTTLWPGGSLLLQFRDTEDGQGVVIVNARNPSNVEVEYSSHVPAGETAILIRDSSEPPPGVVSL